MDTTMNDGQVAAQDAAWDKVILNLQHQVQQLMMANTMNQQNPRKDHKHIESISTKLPDFDGKGDVDIWIKKVKLILKGKKYPVDRWMTMTIQSLKDTAEAFWFNLVNDLGTNDIPWHTFREKLLK